MSVKSHAVGGQVPANVFYDEECGVLEGPTVHWASGKDFTEFSTHTPKYPGTDGAMYRESYLRWRVDRRLAPAEAVRIARWLAVGVDVDFFGVPILLDCEWTNQVSEEFGSLRLVRDGKVIAFVGRKWLPEEKLVAIEGFAVLAGGIKERCSHIQSTGFWPSEEAAKISALVLLADTRPELWAKM